MENVNTVIAPALVGKVSLDCRIFSVILSCKFHYWLRFNALFFYCVCLQDPTEQTKIDNYMVQQLDGTVNEWGWCKQKVS